MSANKGRRSSAKRGNQKVALTLPSPGGRGKALRIGYLPFYVDYYEGICPDFPKEKAAVAQRCAAALSSYGEVVWNGELIRDVASATVAGEALAQQDIDCVVVVTTIAVFSAIPLAALAQLSVPILIWSAQQIREVGRDYSMVEIVRNTSQIGTQALANTLLRHGRRFRVIAGSEGSAHSMQSLARYFRIMQAAAAVRRAKLLAIGEPFALMDDVAIDERDLKEHTGAQIIRIAPEHMTRRYVEIPEEAVDQHEKTLRGSHKIEDISLPELRRSARLCEAVIRLADEHHADAGSLNCHAGNCLRNPEIGITACYSLGYQNALGRPFTCTGDLPTALAMLILKRLTGAAMYTEVQVMDESRNAVVIANSGEGEDAIRRRGAPSVVRGNTNFKGVHGRGASFAYPLQSGPATILSLTPTPNGPKKYRLIAAEGKILPDALPDAGALAGFFRFGSGDVNVAYTRWLEAGPVHHAATAPGHWAVDLAEVADVLDMEFLKV